jgi:AcrR family transcriptional regulator
MSTKVKRQRADRMRPPHGATSSLPAPESRDAAEAPDRRAAEIQRAAFEAFAQHGVAGATTDEIARRARVSKREIYRLFGSKEALFAGLVRERAAVMRRVLTLAPPADTASALDALERFGREFLALLTAPTTIAIYRMAVGEVARAPELGRTLDVEGRGTVMSALAAWLSDAAERRALPVPDAQRAAAAFMALLVGDLPVRLMLGATATPSEDELARRAALARAGFASLWLAERATGR